MQSAGPQKNKNKRWIFMSNLLETSQKTKHFRPKTKLRTRVVAYLKMCMNDDIIL